MLLKNIDLIQMHVIEYLFDKANLNNIAFNDKIISCRSHMSYISAYETAERLIESQEIRNENPFTFEKDKEIIGISLPITVSNFTSNVSPTYEGYADERGIIRIEFLINEDYLDEHLMAIDNFKRELALLRSISLEEIFTEIWDKIYKDQYPEGTENEFLSVVKDAYLTLAVNQYNPTNRQELIKSKRIYSVEMRLEFDYTKGYAQSNFMKYEIKRSDEDDDQYKLIPMILPTDRMQMQPEGIMYLDSSRMEQVVSPSSSALTAVMFMPAVVEEGDIFAELLNKRWDLNDDNTQTYDIRITMPYRVNDPSEPDLLLRPTITNTYCIGGINPFMIPGQKFTFSVDFVLTNEMI